MDEYKSLSFEERVNWWSAATYRQMRWQAEDDLDQLLLFDKGWYEKARIEEPKILEILELVCARFGIPFQLVQQLIEHELGSAKWTELRSTIPETDYV